MRQTFSSLQAARGVAALAVVGFHANIATSAFITPPPAPVQSVLSLGYLGVDFFFVLSGFIIAHAHRGDARDPKALRRYAGRRLSRIYPAYWPIGCGMLLVYAVLPGLSAIPTHDVSVVSSLLLVPASAPPALAVAWTLVHEMLFYTVFAVRYLSQRIFVAVLIGWAASILVASLWVPVTNPALAYATSFLNLEFMFGLLAAWLTTKAVVTRHPVVTGLLALALLVGALWLPLQLDAKRLVLAAGLAFLVTTCVVAEAAGRMTTPRWSVFLGGASYAIYLVHVPALSVLARLDAWLATNWATALLTLTLGALAVGVLYHLLVEVPLLRLARQLLASPGLKRGAAAAAR
jgi:peptidoglycan/LPS O-acetylase OafA/YrhL